MFKWFNRFFAARKSPEPSVVLLTMRLSEMLRVHPQMDRMHNCARCGESVGIYPSGQRVLRDYPRVTILCNVCEPRQVDINLAPGAISESLESHWRDE